MFSRSNTSSPTTTRKNSFDSAKTYFSSRSTEHLFIPEIPFTAIMTLPFGQSMPGRISPGIIVLTVENDSEGKEKIRAGIATDQTITDNSPSKSSIRAFTTVQQALTKNSPNAITYLPQPETSHGSQTLCQQDANALLAAFDLSANIMCTSKFTGTFLNIDHKLFNIKESIGAGSSATIYRACDQDDNSYAIKFFNITSPENTALANNETKTLQKLGRLSASSISYYDSLSQDNYQIVVMPYIADTVQLSEYLAKNSTFNLKQRCDLAIKLCLLVGQLHQKDIAHGDIKPANILINSTTLELFLVDFERAAHNIDTVQEHKGTEIYMLPSDANLTRRQADIVALKRCLHLDGKFLTANSGKHAYTPAAADIAIFKTATEEAQAILSTCFLATDNTTKDFSKLKNLQSSAAHLAFQLAPHANCSDDKKIQFLTFAGLEYKKHKLNPNSYAHYYASYEYNSDSEDNKKNLLQACRIMAHEFKLNKMSHIRSNPFFAKAIELVQITDSELKDALYSKNPSQISTYANMYRVSDKYQQDGRQLENNLKEAGLYV